MDSKGALSGKIVIITGAGSGIGRALAIALASAGSSVVVADLRKDAAQEVARTITAAGGCAEAREVDVTDAASVERLGASTVEAHAVWTSW